MKLLKGILLLLIVSDTSATDRTEAQADYIVDKMSRDQLRAALAYSVGTICTWQYAAELFAKGESQDEVQLKIRKDELNPRVKTKLCMIRELETANKFANMMYK